MQALSNGAGRATLPPASSANLFRLGSPRPPTLGIRFRIRADSV